MGGSGIFDPQSLGKYLPDDLTTLKRQTGKRNARGIEEPEGEIITLQDELDVIVKDYNEVMSLLVPPVEGVAFADGVRIEDGLIYLSDDEIVPQYTLEGIAIAEVLTAISNGEDGEEAAERISAEIESMFTGENEGSSRGLYIKPVPLWSGGVVKYKWGDMRDGFRKATRKAMDRWTSATGGKVKFEEFDAAAWNTFLLIIGIQHIVRIEEKALDGAFGMASPGSYPWGIAFMQLDPRCENTVNAVSYSAYSVALHELGHVLGLQHEHQRWDRDTYIDVSVTKNNFLNNTRLPEISLPSLRIVGLEWKRTMVGCIPVWYPVVIVRVEMAEQFVKTGWDFNSIMLYEGFKIKPSYANAANGKKEGNIFYTRYNTELSAKDIEIIKRLY
ncbi:MAG: matrixin family metalloprotease [Treponema sp.]|jgi:hypothetical protein|nr:matrixin family metalloprotease [Treponema sp.]